MPRWRDYQDEAAAFFRQLGMDAKGDFEVQGVRDVHKIDVLVRIDRRWISQVWIVECKHWKRRVNKLHVEALADILSDVGADRGFMLSEKGFQSGAIRTARFRNITLTSLQELREDAADEIAEVGLVQARQRIAEFDNRLRRANDIDRVATPGTGFWVRSDDNMALFNQLSWAEMGIREAERHRWPVLYAVDVVADRGCRANTPTELAEGLFRILDSMEPEVVRLEQSLERSNESGNAMTPGGRSEPQPREISVTDLDTEPK